MMAYNVFKIIQKSKLGLMRQFFSGNYVAFLKDKQTFLLGCS